jgi:5-methylcytosine-specific restriction endonuclease McrA
LRRAIFRTLCYNRIVVKSCSKCKTEKAVDEFSSCKTTRDKRQSWCKGCVREANRLRQNGRYVTDSEFRAHALKYSKGRYATDQEFRKHALEYNKQRLADDPEYREKHAAGIRKWGKEHPEALRRYNHTRRSRKVGAGEGFTVAQWESLKTSYGSKCLCCGCTEPEIKLTPDHVIPLCKGGKGSIANIQPLCLGCNMRKGSQSIDYR